MKKRITFLFFSLFLVLGFGASAQNLIGDWDANGATGTGTQPNEWGWGSDISIAWGDANGGGIRYVDVNNHTYEDPTGNVSNYTGRVLLERWDYGGYAGSTYSLGIPADPGVSTVQNGISLNACTTYNLSGKFEWWNNGNRPTYRFAISTAPVGGTVIAYDDFLASNTKNRLLDFNVTFTVPSNGDYYIQLTEASGGHGLIGLADLSLAADPTESLYVSESSLSFNPGSLTKTFVVTGNSLLNDVTLTAPAGISLDQTTITAANAQCGVTVTATFDGTTSIESKDITIASGSLSQSVAVNSYTLGPNYAMSMPGGSGSSSNIDISGLNLTTLPFTVEMWIKPDGTQIANTGLFFDRPGNDGFQYVSGWYGDANAIRFMANGGDTYGVPTSVSASQGAWHHLAIVLTSTSRTVYLDGVAKTESASFSPIDWSAGNLYIGWDSGASNRGFKGLIDEVRVWNVAKTAQQLKDSKFISLNGSEAGLVGYWPFDDFSATATDLTGNGDDGTINGGNYVPSFDRKDATLKSLTSTDNVVISPSLNPDVTNYTLTYHEENKSVNIVAYANAMGAAVTGTGKYDISTTDTITVTVNSADETVTKNYKVALELENLLDDVRLDDLSCDKGFLDPMYDNSVDVYNVVVPDDIETVNLHAKTHDSGASITGAGSVDLSSGNTTSTVVVMGEDGTTKRTITVSFVKSDVNYAMSLPGGSDGRLSNITIPALSVDHLPVTIELWFKPDETESGTNRATVWYSRKISAEKAGYGFQYDHNTDVSKVKAVWDEEAGLPVAKPVPGKWNHLALVVTEDSKTFYINDVPFKESATSYEVYHFFQELYLGWDNVDFTNPPQRDRTLKGEFDEFRVWTVARTAEEIKDNEYKRLNGDEPGLIGYWNFDNHHSQYATDGTKITAGHQIALNGEIHGGTYVVSDLFNPMEIDSSACLQASTDPVMTKSRNNPIIKLIINASNYASPYSLKSLNLNTTGTTNISDIDKIAVYYTSKDSFDVSNRYGKVDLAGTSLTVNGNQQLTDGPNYLWITYDIKDNATLGDVVDAECTSFTLAGVDTITVSPTTNNLEGNRLVVEHEAEPFKYAMYLPGSNGSNIDISGLSMDSFPFTIEMWIKPEGNQFDNSGLLYNRPGNYGLQYCSGWQGSGKLRFMAAGGDQYASPTLTNEVVPGEWHHVAVVMTTTSRTVYMDGEAKTEDASFTPIDWSAGNLYLGWDSDNASKAFDGIIDQVSIWNTTKSTEELDASEPNAITGSENGLVAFYNFEDTANTVTDVTGHNTGGEINDGQYIPINDASLSSIELSAGSLNQDVDQKETEYTAIVPYGTTSLTMSAIPTVEHGAVAAYESTVNLVDGEGYSVIAVTAADGKTTKIYTVNFGWADESSDATLASLDLSVGSIDPEFSPSGLDYSALVPPGTNSVNVIAVSSSSNATVVGDGAIDVSAGSGKAVIMVTSPNGEVTNTYTVELSTNLIEDWDGNGATGDSSSPDQFGWNGAESWNTANAGGGIRYIDKVAGTSDYTYNGDEWSGRLLYTRWDGSGGTNTSTVFSYPVQLEACKSYKFTGKYGWNSNASGTSTYTIGINSAADNSGTSLASNQYTVSDQNRLKFFDASFTFIPTVSGTYYLTITNDLAMLGAVADLSIIEDQSESLVVSESSLLFEQNTDVQTFVVSGNALTNDITLTAPAGIALDVNTVSKEDAQCGVMVTATFDQSANISDVITAESGTLSKTINVTAMKPADVAEGQEYYIVHEASGLVMGEDPATGNAKIYEMSPDSTDQVFMLKESNHPGEYFIQNGKTGYLSLSTANTWDLVFSADTATSSDSYRFTLTEFEPGRFYIQAVAKGTSKYLGTDNLGNGDGIYSDKPIRDKSIWSFVKPEDMLASNDATLSSLTVDAGALDPLFDAATDAYSVLVPQGTASVSVNATTNDANAIVAGIGAVDVSSGSGTASIVVTAEDGTTTMTYTVNITVDTNTGVNDLESSSVAVYPTISSRGFHVAFDGVKNGIITVYNLYGQVISQRVTTSTIENINVPNAGIYLIKVQAGGTNKVVKVLKTE